MPDNKLVLIDGYAILHRALHALPPLTNKRGELTNAVYGLVSMLLRVITDLEPTHIAFCLDEKEPTFRKKEFVAYQAHRPKMYEGLESQIQKAKDVINAFGIPMYSKPGFEADDVIGTLVYQVTESKRKTPALQLSRSSTLIDEVIIVTGDRDILQLVNDKVKVYMPILGLSQGKLFGKNEVVEKMGVTPELIPDYKALVGDPSDNYKGVNGIGPKTAIKLINEFGEVTSIYKNLKKIPLQTREKLEKDKDSALISHKLATIVKDVSVKLDLDKAGKWDIDSQKVLDEFARLGFKTLAERVKKVGQQIDSEKQLNLL